MELSDLSVFKSNLIILIVEILGCLLSTRVEFNF